MANVFSVRKGTGTRQPTLPNPIWERVFPLLRENIGAGREFQVKQVAEHLGIKSPSVSSWINNKGRPTVPNLIGVLRFIGQDPSALLPEFFTEDSQSILERAVGQLALELPAQATEFAEAAKGLSFDSPELADVEKVKSVLRGQVMPSGLDERPAEFEETLGSRGRPGGHESS